MFNLGYLGENSSLEVDQSGIVLVNRLDRFEIP